MKKVAALSALVGLAQETRLDIFRLLVEAGPDGLPAGVIAERLAMPGATLSFHLKEMSRSNLVIARPEGRFIYYAANFDTSRQLVDFLTENCCAGKDCGVPGRAPAKRRSAAGMATLSSAASISNVKRTKATGR